MNLKDLSDPAGYVFAFSAEPLSAEELKELAEKYRRDRETDEVASELFRLLAPVIPRADD